ELGGRVAEEARGEKGGGDARPAEERAEVEAPAPAIEAVPKADRHDETDQGAEEDPHRLEPVGRRLADEEERRLETLADHRAEREDGQAPRCAVRDAAVDGRLQ